MRGTGENYRQRGCFGSGTTAAGDRTHRMHDVTASSALAVGSGPIESPIAHPSSAPNQFDWLCGRYLLGGREVRDLSSPLLHIGRPRETTNRGDDDERPLMSGGRRQRKALRRERRVSLNGWLAREEGRGASGHYVPATTKQCSRSTVMLSAEICSSLRVKCILGLPLTASGRNCTHERGWPSGTE